MEHEPRSLLSYLHRAVKLPRTDAVLAVRDQPHCGQPLIQPERAILKDSSGLDGELTALVAFVALPAIVLFLKGHIVRSATWALHAIAPAPGDYVVPAVNRIV